MARWGVTALNEWRRRQCGDIGILGMQSTGPRWAIWRAYTGLTRVVVIGQKKALAVAVRNNKTDQRFSGLLERLTRDGT